MKNPLVTVNILSFNRKDELRVTLTKVYEQDYKNIEIIVVDNASSDGSGQMVKDEFPDVILIQLEKNIGIAGWNRGFDIAKGEYILVLDDDCYPEKNSIDLAVSKLNKFNNIGCITFNVLDYTRGYVLRGNWQPDESVNETFWPVFIGCGAIFKGKLIKEIKFPEDYFLYQHELPPSTEIHNKNFRIFYSKEITAYHNFKEFDKYYFSKDIQNFKNTIRFILEKLPIYLVVFYYIQVVIFYLFRSIRHSWFILYINTLKSIKINTNNKRMTIGYLLFLRKYNLFNQPISSKIKNIIMKRNIK